MATEFAGSKHSVALRADLIKALYRQKPTILIASIVNATIVTLVLWEASPQPWPALWLALVIAVALGRVALMSRYHRIPPGEAKSELWARLLVVSAAASGILWGASGVLFFTPGNALYQVFLVFVIGGMCAGAAAVLSTHMMAFYAFVLPSLTPLIVRLWLEGEAVQMAMGLMLALFSGAMVVLARNVHRTVVEAIKERLEKEALLEERAGHEERLEVEVAERTADLGAEIAERERAEEALQRSEERYRNLYNRTPAMLQSYGRDHRFVSVSDHWLEVMGYQRDEVIGRHIIEFVTEESRQLFRNESLPALLRSGIASDLSRQLIKKNGEILDTLISTIVERDDRGDPAHFLSVIVDVTERKRAEDALRESEARLSIAHAVAGVGSWDLDLVKDEMYWSEQTYEILGLSSAKVAPSASQFLPLIHNED